jgi:hypothetical protein
MSMTKKDKLEHYDAVAAERDLLSLYLYDMETGAECVREREGNVRVRLYRALGASGGYIVINQRDSSPQIEYFERYGERMRGYYDNDTLPIRLCLERLSIARNRMVEAAMNRTSNESV